LLEHVGFLRAIALGVLRNEADADDVVQQTLATAIQKPPAEDTNLRGWLATVAKNFARMQLRGRSRRVAREAAVARTEGTPSTAQIAQRMEMERHVVDAISTLDEPFRTTLILRYYDDMQPKEIAQRTGVPAATVRTRIKRGLDKLRADLEKKCGGNKKAMYAGLLLLAQLPARAAATMSLAPAAGVAAVILGILGIAWLAAPDSERSASRTEPTREGPVAGGGATPEPDAPDAPQAECRIEGRLLDEKGDPVPGAEVVAYPQSARATLDTPLRRLARWTTRPKPIANSMVGTDGRYSLSIRPARPVWLVAHAEGRADEILRLTDATGEYRGVDLVLRETPGVRGRVFDDAQRPLPNVPIHAWNSNADDTPALITTTTDEEGRYSLPLPHHDEFGRAVRVTFVIDARNAGYAIRVFRAHPPSLRDWTLFRGRPMEISTEPGAHVLAVGRYAVDLRVADARGEARFDEMPDDHRSVLVMHPDKVPAFATVRELERVVRLQPAREIEGVVLLSGTDEPLADAAIGFASINRGPSVMPLRLQSLTTARTDDAGRFRLSGVHLDSGWIVVNHPRLAAPQKFRDRYGDMGAGADPIELKPTTPFSAEGRIWDSASRGVAGARVRASMAGRHWMALTRPDGTYRIGVPLGANIRASHPRHGTALSRALDSEHANLTLLGGAFEYPEKLEPTHREPEPTYRLIRVRVSSPRGIALEGVELWTDRRPSYTVRLGERREVDLSVSGSDPVTVVLRTPTGWIKRVKDVKPGSHIHVLLPDVVTVSGRVVHGGAPIPRALVRVLVGNSIFDRARTDEDGRFRLRFWPQDGPRELIIERPGFLTYRADRWPGTDIELERAAALVVAVVDGRGAPRTGVELLVGKRIAVTDRQGLIKLYRKEKLQPSISVRPGGPGWIVIGKPKWSRDRAAVTLVVRRGERIEGTVLDADKRGVAHVLVVAKPTREGLAVRRAFTDSKGRFLLRALHPERYRLHVDNAERAVEVVAGRRDVVLHREAK
ncbi:MAG: sigma-70 family RNA polymerase sigma factor, partial [Planctomycetota bacterium]